MKNELVFFKKLRRYMFSFYLSAFLGFYVLEVLS